MHSATLELYPTSVVKNDEMVRLCSYMSQGLHALAQPLTIVRSAMAALTTPGVTAVERRRYLELSTQNVERTCSLFECLQDLVIASQIEANCEPMELSQLLADVADDQKTALQASSVELRIAITDTPAEPARRRGQNDAGDFICTEDCCFGVIPRRCGRVAG
jgi:light-regulated signal transduction histidine kinase (bacteriophytochrome)